MVALYRSKQLSPVEFLTATLDRIDRLGRLYNTFVVIDGDIPPAWQMHQWARRRENQPVAKVGPYGRAGWPFLKSIQALLGEKTSLDLH
jgi:Asp-tRNA(Asn)/Glu-tRNA(Gln) amidotransferase A subunit family amidase